MLPKWLTSWHVLLSPFLSASSIESGKFQWQYRFTPVCPNLLQPWYLQRSLWCSCACGSTTQSTRRCPVLKKWEKIAINIHKCHNPDFANYGALPIEVKIIPNPAQRSPHDETMKRLWLQRCIMAKHSNQISGRAQSVLPRYPAPQDPNPCHRSQNLMLIIILRSTETTVSAWLSTRRPVDPQSEMWLKLLSDQKMAKTLLFGLMRIRTDPWHKGCSSTDSTAFYSYHPNSALDHDIPWRFARCCEWLYTASSLMSIISLASTLSRWTW